MVCSPVQLGLNDFLLHSPMKDKFAGYKSFGSPILLPKSPYVVLFGHLSFNLKLDRIYPEFQLIYIISLNTYKAHFKIFSYDLSMVLLFIFSLKNSSPPELNRAHL